ncbi:MAG: hypothetical protein BGO98_21355 [Myxococcales bacterium 68-20]|nr:MAG: hypothetical protein BGO98_21355 [Myxococcales bacterium 68-20]
MARAATPASSSLGVVAVASAGQAGARARRSSIARSASLACGLALLLGCGPKAEGGPPVGMSTKGDVPLPSTEKATHYAFDPLDERPVSSEAHRGKPTIIAFVTTGDIIGQAQVSYLVHMAKNDGDRINYALVALHPRKEIVLVDTYRATLGVEFPVALGDHSATNAAGPFGEIPAVPTIVILDHEGRIVWKHTGLAKNDEIRGHMHGL